MIIRRGDHWNDERIGGRTTRRRVQNHLNYRTPAGIIAPTKRGVALQDGPPAHWQGAWDVSHAQLDAPLQVYTRDNTDPSNRALMAVNPARRPDVWVTWKAHNANACEPEFSDGGCKVVYEGLWDAIDWELWISPHKVKDYIHFHMAERPSSSCTWTLKLAPGCALDPRSGGIHLLDSEGVSHGRISYPIAWDANGSEENPDIRVSMALGEPIGPYLTLVITIHADDFAAAVGDITVDPEIRIEGTTDIEDAQTSYGNGKNFGGATWWSSQSSAMHSLMLRINKPALEVEGTIERLQYFAWTTKTYYPSYEGAHLNFYAVRPANTWGEGVGNNSIAQDGECTSFLCAKPTFWVGYSAQAGYVQCCCHPVYDMFPENVMVLNMPQIDDDPWQSMDIHLQTVKDWASGALACNGLVGLGYIAIGTNYDVVRPYGSDNGAFTAYTSEYSYNPPNEAEPPYFLLDYNEGGGLTLPAMFLARRD